MSALDDFEPAEERSSWTDELEFTSSTFAISSSPIRYYLTTIRLSALKDYFKLVDEIPGSASWGYNAIFQRDIDVERVEQDLLKNYLLNTNKFKFFNPLTIALLPFDASRNQVKESYGEVSPASDRGNMTEETVGGINIRTRRGATVGYIKWDRDRVYGVAIDGQHRLLALMKYASHPERPAGVDPAKVRIPVVLLVFDTTASNILSQVREIFIDINKNAEPVTLARQILLDNRDPYAVFARDLIKDKDNAVGLRYEVVDWKRESIRPEGDHQLTTIVVLYEIIRNLFRSRLGFGMLESELDLNKELKARGLERISAMAGPGHDLSEAQIQAALELFRKKHKPFILHVFEELSPFKALLAKVGELVDPSTEASKRFREYLFRPTGKREAYRDELKTEKFDPEEVIEKPLAALKLTKQQQVKVAELLFTSIGQRGLFAWFPNLRRVYALAGHKNLEGIAKEYVDDLNIMVANSIFTRDRSIGDLQIWQGICIRGDKIAASNASIDRFGALVLLMVAARRLSLETVDALRRESRVDLRKVTRLVLSEFKKQWLSRLDDAVEDDYEDEDIGDEEDEDLVGDELTDEESVNDIAQRNAEDSLEKLLKSVRKWGKTDTSKPGTRKPRKG